MNEDAPTMSVGNGGFTGSAAPTGPNAGFDPLMSAKVKRRKYKPKGHVIKNVGIGEAVEIRVVTYHSKYHMMEQSHTYYIPSPSQR